MLTDSLKKISFFVLFLVIASLAFSISFYEITSILFILISIFLFLTDTDKQVLRGRWALFFTVYFIVNLLSLTQTHYPADSWKGILRVTRSILLCLSVIYTVDSEEKFRKLFFWCLWVAFFISVDGLLQGFTGYEVIRHRNVTGYLENGGRITSTFRHANDFAAYLTLMLIFFAGILSEAKSLKLSAIKIIALGLGALSLFISILWTYSRGSWMAVGFTLLLMAVFKGRKLLLGVFAILIIWVIFFSPPLVRIRAQSLWDPKNGTITERKVLAQESFDMIEKSPWLGMGLNTFSDNAPFYKSKTVHTDVQYAHNGYLQMAVETGIVGLIGFLALLIYFFCSTAPILLKQPVGFLEAGGFAVVFGVLAFLIHSFTDTDLHSLLLVSNLWLCMGLAWAAALISKNRKIATP